MSLHSTTNQEPDERGMSPDAVYPIVLTQMQEAPVVVVGGGQVGERKVRGLLAVGARVKLVSPTATPSLQSWTETGRIDWQKRSYQTGDLAEARLVFAATNQREVNAQIAQEAEALGLWCNVADNPADGNFYLPAVHREAGLVIAVSTAGKSPSQARQVRDRLAEWLESQTESVKKKETPSGKAYLVGGGPGRADLITVRGLSLLRQADVVLYDRLIARELLDEAPAHAELIFVGKRPERHLKPQEEITQLIIDRVRAGKQVVRLKGGDPFVFGRGGEEALALARAGLPLEIVPGISSAVAGPAYAGVPVTHRGLSTAFAVVTGHEAPNKPQSTTDWAALAKLPTLIILMAVKRIEAICAALMEAGRQPDTPAVVISWGTTDRQQVLPATLETLPCRIAEHQLPTPAIVVIGEVAALANELAWFQPDGQAAGFVPVQ
jgi:uroporphyrin-III C-methyltransferase/precorrin-2 dehydrogenase/sirohydrochlorin ferrochelatase